MPITVNDEENHRKTTQHQINRCGGSNRGLKKHQRTKAKKYGHVTTSMLVGFPQTWSYPRNLVPGGPSCKMRLTRLSPSFRGGGAVGRWSLLIHTQQKRRGRRKVMSTPGNLVTTVTRSKAQETNTNTYPRNCAPVGPTSMMRPARPSPSTIGGMEARRCLFTSLHVTRVGAEHFLGGTMIRRPLWRQPRIAPPLASTMKLTRKLKKGVQQEITSTVFSISKKSL